MRNKDTVVYKDLVEVDEGLWQWKEFALPTEIYTEIMGAMSNDIAEIISGLMETYEVAESNTEDIEDCNNALMELYEMIESEE